MSKDNTVEEIVKQLKDWGWGTEAARGAFTHDQMDKIRQALTEAHQAGIDEAVGEINKKYWLNPKRSKKDTAKENAWNDLGNTLRGGV